MGNVVVVFLNPKVFVEAQNLSDYLAQPKTLMGDAGKRHDAQHTGEAQLARAWPLLPGTCIYPLHCEVRPERFHRP